MRYSGSGSGLYFIVYRAEPMKSGAQPHAVIRLLCLEFASALDQLTACGDCQKPIFDRSKAQYHCYALACCHCAPARQIRAEIESLLSRKVGKGFRNL